MHEKRAKKIKPEEAFFWKIAKKGIRCFACVRKCLIKKGDVGFCKFRENIGKKLVSLNFGRVLFTEKQPIENFLYHFMPGSSVLAVISIGSNLEGKIGFNDKYEKKFEACSFYSPDSLIRKARKENVQSIAFLGTKESDPFVYPEFAFRSSRLALRVNIKPIYVTNGFATDDAIKKLSKYLSAALVITYAFCDTKFYKSFGNIGKTDAIYETLVQLKKQRVFIEIANYVVPKLGDNLEKCSEFASWVVSELDSEIPFHILQFYSEDFPELPATPLKTLEECANEAKKAGLRYVYISNFPHEFNNTYCYNCLQPVIEREVSKLKKFKLVGERCSNCGFRISIKTD